MADKAAAFRCRVDDWRGIHPGFTLTLRPGYTALAGPNGAGKTTLLYQLEDAARSRGFLVFRYSNLESGAMESRQDWPRPRPAPKAKTSPSPSSPPSNGSAPSPPRP